MINQERLPRDIIVIGASAGGVEALVELFTALPDDMPAAIAIVLHRSPLYESFLGKILGRRSALRFSEGEDGAPIERGHVYIAPRDQHMTMRDGTAFLTRGPKEHRVRPAVDPLFRSAATAYGPRVVGVLLSGGGDDGVLGLVAIKSRGGITLAQDPEEARASWMPQSAIMHDDVDAVVPVRQMGRLLDALSRGQAVDLGPLAERPEGDIVGWSGRTIARRRKTADDMG